MSCTNQVTVSQGNTFACTFTWTPGATGPADLLTTTISSSLEDRQNNVYAMTVTKAGDGLSFTVTYPGSTADWAIGTARWDIKFTQGTTIFYSDTMRLDIIGQVTV